MREEQIYTAQADAAGRLDKWLASCAELSRARLRKLIETGFVHLDGAPVTSPSAKVKPGGQYKVSIPPPQTATPLPQDIPLDIYYEDDALIVLEKPAGMPVHPGPGHSQGTLVNALLYHAADSLSGIGGVMRPGIVHRIDKDTSGLLVAAKTDAAHQHLSRQFAAHSVERRYVCFVRGQPKPKTGRIESRLARSPANRQKQAVVKGSWGDMTASEHGRHAVTNYQTLAGYGQAPRAAIGTAQFSKAACELETGRTHQIRVHMAHLGNPLLGDPAYGRQRAFQSSQHPGEVALRAALKSFKRQALHAQTLGFIHPLTKEKLSFSSDLPPDLKRLENALSELNSK